ncbi:MAG TPA: ABC transporter transmembrane domain-containing protein [Alphaproteobacteria bacterium]|nr:ABC transporter transmembrane domain-containing protein [Alphaproteobacteria bacterium]
MTQMEPTIFKFIWRYSKRQQLMMLGLTVASWPILYYTLQLPKEIINKAIGPGASGTQTASFMGYQLDIIVYMLVLCVMFLVLVLISGAIKYFINVFRGRLGERMLRRLRYQLYARLLRFPLPHFKKVAPGEIIPMITAEVDPVGGFIGDSIALPAFQGGMLMVYLGFIFVQDPFLGAAAVALYPIQIWLIPKLQKRVNQLAKQRVRTVRQLADRIGDTISGVQEVHAHDTSRLERADIAARLGVIYEIRYKLFKLKFFIKFLNNFIAQLTPFFFYSVGGYLVIKGEITFGALVAVLAAYKDLASPWKELLSYYQLKEDVKIKYEQVIEQFQPPEILDAALQDQPDGPIEKLTGDIAITNVSLSEDGRVKTVDSVNFTVKLNEHVAIVGPGGSGRDDIAQLLATLVFPTTGSIRIGGARVTELPEYVTGRRMSYVGQTPYMFATTVRENLFYGLKHAPGERELEGEAKAKQDLYAENALHSGNPPDDFEADWIDYADAGVDGMIALERRAIEVLRAVGMEQDIYRMGLLGTIDPALHPHLAEGILKARKTLREQFEGSKQARLVEPFDDAAYNNNATLGENLLFGTPVGDAFDMERLALNPYVLEVLEKSGLIDDMLTMGRSVAETMIEIFADLPPGHEFFEQYSFISSEDLPEYQTTLSRTAKQSFAEMREDDRERLLSLPFKLVPARHRLDVIDDPMRDRLLEARKMFAERMPDELKGTVEFFDAEKYNAAAALQDNILFGKVIYGQAQAQNKVAEMITETLEALNLTEEVMEAGLTYHVGVAGSRLSGAQRQKMGFARAIIKRPDALVVNEGITAMDSAAQAKVLDTVLSSFKDRAVIWALHRPSYAKRFDKVVVMKGGRVVEQGRFEALNKEGTVLYDLLQDE